MQQGRKDMQAPVVPNTITLESSDGRVLFHADGAMAIVISTAITWTILLLFCALIFANVYFRNALLTALTMLVVGCIWWNLRVENLSDSREKKSNEN